MNVFMQHGLNKLIKLQYVVCFSNQGKKLGLVSRTAFVTALCEKNLAQPPIHMGIDEELPAGGTQCLPFYFGAQGGMPGQAGAGMMPARLSSH
eukprot:g15918.t1